MTAFDIEAMNEEVLAKTILELPHQSIHKLTQIMELVFDNLTEESLTNVARISNLHLLSRIYNDLKSIYYLTLKGYSVQAATVACGLYEAALTVTFIDDNIASGRRWFEHKEKKKTFERVSSLRQEAIYNLDWSKEALDKLDKVYTYLSMAKHNNALILSVHSFVEVVDNGEKYKHFSYASEFSEASFRLSCYAVLMSVQLGHVALCTYINNSEPFFDEVLLSEIHDLHLELSDIVTRNIKVSAEKYGEIKSND